jgi:DNA mismatch endonuclease (patch repair protein)
MRVRRAAHAMGLRFRLHRKDLPGTPDLVFPKYKTVVFVHGCFWHRHPGCRKSSTPKSRLEYWQSKFDANVARDARAAIELRQLGWHVATIWECETKEIGDITSKLTLIFSL